jgi:hypothetical protein
MDPEKHEVHAEFLCGNRLERDFWTLIHKEAYNLDGI